MGNRHEEDAKSSLAITDEHDDHARDTIPVPPSRERQDPTPRVNQLQRNEAYPPVAKLAPESPKGDLLDQVMSQIAPQVSQDVSHDAETWRPPPDPPKAEKPSSLAPRERTVAASTSSQDRGSMAALLRVAAIFALCGAAIWMRSQWGDRSQGNATVESNTTQTGAPPAVVAPPPAPVVAPVAPAEAPAAAETAAHEAAAPDEAKPVPSPAHSDAQPLGTPRPAHKRARGASVDVSHLPEEPSRNEVIAGLNQLRGELGECSKGRSGTAEIDLTIAGSGAVTYAVVNGDYAGTPQGSCIARTIRSARFEPFQKPRVRILYRMSL